MCGFCGIPSWYRNSFEINRQRNESKSIAICGVVRSTDCLVILIYFSIYVIFWQNIDNTIDFQHIFTYSLIGGHVC